MYIVKQIDAPADPGICCSRTKGQERRREQGRELHGRKAVETRKDIRVHFGMPMRTLVGHPDTYAHTYKYVCATWRYICISCDSDSDSDAGSGSGSPNYMKL